ncbi:tetratricopeptide repeat protein [Streptomyces sp. NPDC006326]|uniref:tetratricopeptide repeat protein n=1 Tax=Streptomyces sp. NPDC006326 TaxID=3156752 RepID=UPI0033B01B96
MNQVSGTRGDVHITTHVGPEHALYRVDAFPPERSRPTVAKALAQPARLLQAGYALVGFTGRRTELSQLATWRDAAGPVSVLLLHGAGGQGKTRLAAHFADTSRNCGWEVLQARHISDPAPAGPLPGDAGDGTGRGVLLVADYAERWPAADLLALLTHAAVQARPARVLLVARPAGLWWQTLASRLDRLDLDTAELALTPLTDDPDTGPEALFTAARDSFADALELGQAHRITAPATLSNPKRFGQVLAIHMAALAAVHASRTGTTAGELDSPRRISAYLLDRERDHWQTLKDNCRVTATVQTLGRAVYTAALTGALGHDTGCAALAAIGVCPDNAAPQVLDDHAVAYPPADLHSGTVLEPLYPDRLAEDFLALSTPGHHLPYFAPDPWATNAPQRLLLPGDHPDATTTPTADWDRQALTVLIAAAAHWPHLTTRQLIPLLTARPELVIHAGGAALAALSTLKDLPLAVLEAVEAVLPEDRHPDLDPGTAALTARLTPHRLASTDDRFLHSHFHNALALRYANAGLYEQALTASEEAVGILRLLDRERPSRYEADLSGALNNLAVWYGSVGRQAESLAAIEESAQVARRLAATRPEAHEPSFAYALNNLSIRYAEAGRRAEALTVSEEAVAISRRLAKDAPADLESDLARALSNLSNRYADVGRWAEALAVCEEAVAIYRRLTAANPAVYEHVLAAALNNLSNRHRDMGRRTEALTAIAESARIHRRMASVNPAAFEPNLASSLINLSSRLAAVERRTEALPVIEESVAILRRLAEAHPAAHEFELICALNVLATQYADVGRRTEALPVIEASVAIARRLAEEDPAAYEPALMLPLDILASQYAGVGRQAEALPVAEQSVAIARRLAEGDPAAYEPRLAASLNNLAVHYAAMERQNDSLIALEESATIYRRLATANPAAFEPGFAYLMQNLAQQYTDAERALSAVEEAVAIRRRLASRDSAYEADLAESLWAAATVHLRVLPQLTVSSLRFAVEAVNIIGRLAKEVPDVFVARLRTALLTLADVLDRLGHTADAEELRRQLAGGGAAG